MEYGRVFGQQTANLRFSPSSAEVERSLIRRRNLARTWQIRTHFFGAAAEVLGISPATAKRWWAYSRAWLFH